MATLKKFVRTNISLKPWVLAKNTTEIVNACIGNIYKQNPQRFQQELTQAKANVAKLENQGPLRFLHNCQPTPQPPKIQTQKPKVHPNNTNGDRLLCAILNNSANNNGIKKKTMKLAGGTNLKKTLKSVNCKIYGTPQKFLSSASSSNASIFRRFDEKRRNRASNTLLQRRSYGSHFGRCNFGNAELNRALKTTSRNQHMQTDLGSVRNAVEVSNGIQTELMSVDTVVKNRISLGRSKLTKLSPEINLSESNKPGIMRGWDRPLATDMFFSRFHERSVASAELNEQQRKLKMSSKKKFDTVFSRTDFGFSCKQGLRMNDTLRSVLMDPPPRNQQIVAQKLANLMPTTRYTGSKPLEPILPKQEPAPISTPPFFQAVVPRSARNVKEMKSTATALIPAGAVTPKPTSGPSNSRYNHLFYKSHRM